MVPAGDTLRDGGEQISPSGARMFITPIWILSEFLQMTMIDFKDLSSVKKCAIGGGCHSCRVHLGSCRVSRSGRCPRSANRFRAI